ncbi:hypothetical protein AB0B92_40195 [Streptomyces hygroscopicus]|uniref:hypothetical protein n=1 Tax=Streptomyces hygroscopicus TaxID=1912 RepID=UPI0033F3950B
MSGGTWKRSADRLGPLGVRLLGLRSRWARWVCVRPRLLDPRLLGLRLLIACARWAC